MRNAQYEQQIDMLKDMFNTYDKIYIRETIKDLDKFYEMNKGTGDPTKIEFDENLDEMDLLFGKLKIYSKQTLPIDQVVWMLGNYYYFQKICPIWGKLYSYN